MSDRVYVSVRETVRNKYFYEDGATGYGWADKADLLSNSLGVKVQIEYKDSNKEKYFVVRKVDITICKGDTKNE